MFSLLFRVTDLYFDDLVIMQQVSTITMFFAGLEGWESSLMDSGLIQKITSFTYSVCQDPIPSISLSSSVYPLVSITRNLSLSRRIIARFSRIASGIDFIFRYHLLSCIKDVYIHCRGTNNLSDLVCRILLRLTATSRFDFFFFSLRRKLRIDVQRGRNRASLRRSEILCGKRGNHPHVHASSARDRVYGK